MTNADAWKPQPQPQPGTIEAFDPDSLPVGLPPDDPTGDPWWGADQLPPPAPLPSPLPLVGKRKAPSRGFWLLLVALTLLALVAILLLLAAQFV